LKRSPPIAAGPFFTMQLLDAPLFMHSSMHSISNLAQCSPQLPGLTMEATMQAAMPLASLALQYRKQEGAMVRERMNGGQDARR